MSREGIGLKGKMLSLLCLRFWKNCGPGFRSVLDRGLASCWGIIGMDGITKQGSGAARWELTLWDHCSVFLTIQYHCFTVRLCGPWGRVLEHWGDSFGCISDFRRSLVFNRHTECTGMQDVQFCTMKNYSGIFLISKYPTGHSYRWKIYF